MVAEALVASPEFRALMESPVATREEQIKGVAAVLESFKVSSLTQDFFRTLAENRRLTAASGVIKVYADLLAQSLNEATAEVTTAYPLAAKQRKELQEALKKATGRADVHINLHEDPQILGGVIVRVDGKMFDNSIANKVNRLASLMRGQVQS